MSIVSTPEKDLSNVDCKSYTRKLHTSSVNSSAELFSCSIRAMYNISNNAQKQHFMLNSYLPVIHTSIFPKRHYKNIS